MTWMRWEGDVLTNVLLPFPSISKKFPLLPLTIAYVIAPFEPESKSVAVT